MHAVSNGQIWQARERTRKGERTIHVRITNAQQDGLFTYEHVRKDKAGEWRWDPRGSAWGISSPTAHESPFHLCGLIQRID